MSTRKTCVAGQFYPDDPDELINVVKTHLGNNKSQAKSSSDTEKALAIMIPHAGFIYSGNIAGTTYSTVNIPSTIVLIGPNHTGLGAAAAISNVKEWQSPLGTVKVDRPLAELVEDSSPLFTFDDLAHQREHSLEVQLPFIQHINPNTSIVPITVSTKNIKDCQEMGKGLARAIDASDKEVLIVISSDMNHYESDRVTREKDQMAIAQCLHLDGPALIDVCNKRGITMCGAVPMAIGMTAAKELGADSSTLTGYTTSGEVSQDTEQVVGYAGIMIR